LRPDFFGYRPEMLDPLTQVISLLSPRTVFAKGISGAGRWAVRYSEFGQPSFCAIIDGACRLAVDGHEAIDLQAGDFVLLPATPGFTLSGLEPVQPTFVDPAIAQASVEEVRHGDRAGEPDVRLLGGYFMFDSPDAGLLVSLLPPVVHLRGAERLAILVRLVREEATGQQPGRDLILARLVEILLIEALRAAQGDRAPVGMLRGLADPRLAIALRHIHGDPARQWTMADLATRSALSRSAFFDRFTRVIGMSPMGYLMAWRMALAKDLLRERVGLAEVAERVGYGSQSTFSTAFARHVGQSPGRYARAQIDRQRSATG
jgi:AraC-like DNA-binding protein